MEAASFWRAIQDRLNWACLIIMQDNYNKVKTFSNMLKIIGQEFTRFYSNNNN